MLCNMIQPRSFLGFGEEDLLINLVKMFLPYMSMVAILFNSAELFEQIGNTHSTEGPMQNLVKLGQAVSEK